MDSEEPVFEAVLNWVKHNRKEREPYLPDMLEFVRMPLLTPRYITDVIDAEVSQTAAAASCVIMCQASSEGLSVDGIIKLVLTRFSPSFAAACRVETSLMRPRNST